MQNRFIFDHVLAGTDKYFERPIRYSGDWGYLQFDKPKLMTPQVGSDTPNLGLLMLPPPKRFLLEGSHFNTSPDTVYNVYRTARTRRPGNECAVNVESNKLRIYEDKLQLIRATFFFKRDKNMMSEDKAGFNMLTYSIKKKALYSITTKKNLNDRYVKTLRRISLNKFHIHSMHHDSGQFDRWVSALHDAIKRDVPDVYDECNHDKSRIISLIIQHRMGKGIQGLSDQLIDNLGHITSMDFALHVQKDTIGPYINGESIDSEQKRTMAAVNKHKKDTVYKFLPTLEKTGSVNKALKVLLGKHYSRTMIQLIQKFQLDMLTQGREDKFVSSYNSMVPTTAKHMLTKYVRNNENGKASTLIAELANALVSMEFDEAHEYVIANWVKTMKRIDNVIRWTMWKDMYVMAEQLHIRVRPSRFITANDAQRAHDGYSRLMRTVGNNNNLDLPVHMLNFIEVDAPDTYKGYIIRQLVSQADLTTETDHMGHCVHSYGDRCMRGGCVIFSVQNENGDSRWTVEYSGDDFSFRHAEGIGHSSPSNDFRDEFLRPFGKELYKRESKKPLSYRLRSGFKADYISLLYSIDVTEDVELTMIEEDLEKVFEMHNCRLERLAQINRLIESDTPPSGATLVHLASKIGVDQVDNFLIRNNQNNPPIQVHQNNLPHLPLDPFDGIEEPIDNIGWFNTHNLMAEEATPF